MPGGGAVPQGPPKAFGPAGSSAQPSVAAAGSGGVAQPGESGARAPDDSGRAAASEPSAMQMAEVMQQLIARMNEVESELRSSAAKQSELQNIVQQQQQLLQSQQSIIQQTSMTNDKFSSAMESIEKTLRS